MFFITCNDRVRMWVNSQLVIHSWAKTSSGRVSSQIFLNVNQWVPIYIQYQCDVGSSPYFSFEYSSVSSPRGGIDSSQLAWDNNPPAAFTQVTSQDTMVIYNSTTLGANSARLSVDAGGDLTIDASGNDVILGVGDNLNIPAHDGLTKGLFLGGVLVQPTAYELNYLKVSPGTAAPSRALVADASKSIAGISTMSVNSMTCGSLSLQSLTIEDINITGPVNNYNTGQLLIRQFTGPNVSGRIVNVDTITDLNLTNYDPRELNTQFSLDISGYVLPPYTENFRFYVVANDRARIWVNGVLVLNVWDTTSGLEYMSDSVALTAAQWAPIYIQFQNITGSSMLQVRWSSPSLVKGFIDSSRMAWDNSVVRPFRSLSAAENLTVFSGASGLTTLRMGSVAVDGNGVMTLTATSGVASPTFNVSSHNGSTDGLRLAGVLVTSSSTDLNRLTAIAPGSCQPSKALVVDSEKGISGISSITSIDINGTIRTANQPYITQLGTLSATLNTSSDIVIGSGTNARFRLVTDATSCSLQPDASADFVVSDQGAVSLSASTRKFVVKAANGFVGVQTTTPGLALTVNGAGANNMLRLMSKASDSSAPVCDVGVDGTTGYLKVSTAGVVIGSSSTKPCTLTTDTSTGVATLTATSLRVGNTTNSILPLEIGSTAFTITTRNGYLSSDGSTGTAIPSATAYSLRTTSSIIINGSICVASDARLKCQVEPLTYEECRRFIMTSRPVRYLYTRDPIGTSHCGLIAQEVSKSKFSDLVHAAPCNDLPEEVDYEGYVSPKDVALNIAYEEIVPILMTTMKEILQENALLKAHVLTLDAQVKAHTARLRRFDRRFNMI